MRQISKRVPDQGLVVRIACETDIQNIAEMVDDFVKGHPAEKHTRSRSALREAYFGSAPVANLVVAVRTGRVIGMGQWTRIYDMFWSMFGGYVEWLYVRPEHRGSGVVLAIVAYICAEVRRAGGEFLHGGGGDDVEPYMSVSRLVARHTNVTCRQKRFKSLLISLVFPLAT